jgi:hypothetical protein
VPIASIERTAVDIAADLSTPQALVTVDAALRRGVPRQQLIATLRSLGRVQGCRTARQTLEWADPHSESALESAGRGELLVRQAPPPYCNVSFRIDDTEFRADEWWPQFALLGEADGQLKYCGDAEPTSLWKEKLRQEWFEDVVGLPVLRYIDAEVRLAPDELFERWRRKVDRAERRRWTPPPGLEIFQRPPPGSAAPWQWFLRRDDARAPRWA